MALRANMVFEPKRVTECSHLGPSPSHSVMSSPIALGACGISLSLSRQVVSPLSIKR